MGRAKKRGPPWPSADKVGPSLKRSRMSAAAAATASNARDRKANRQQRREPARKVRQSGSDEQDALIGEAMMSTTEDQEAIGSQDEESHDLRPTKEAAAPSKLPGEQPELYVSFPELETLRRRYEVVILRITANVKLRAKVKALLESLRDDIAQDGEGGRQKSDSSSRSAAGNAGSISDPMAQKGRVAVLQAKGNCPAAGKMISVVEIAKRELSGQALHVGRTAEASPDNVPTSHVKHWYQYTRLDGRLEEWAGEDARSRRKEKLLQLAKGGAGSQPTKTAKDSQKDSAVSATNDSKSRTGGPQLLKGQSIMPISTIDKEDGELSDVGGNHKPQKELLEQHATAAVATSHDTADQGGSARRKPGIRNGSGTLSHAAHDPSQSDRQIPTIAGGKDREDETSGNERNDNRGDHGVGKPGSDAGDSGGVDEMDGESDDGDEGVVSGSDSSDDEDDAFEYMQPTDARQGGAASATSRPQRLSKHRRGGGDTIDAMDARRRGVKVRSVPILSIILSRTRIAELEASLR